ncbi:MAG: alpha/beta fold hydrolase, partial [Pseudomonadota bacterium]
LIGTTLLWVLWAETRPEQERWLRNEAQARLLAWFPEPMAAPAGENGFVSVPEPVANRPLVILVHGLDEPGGIFDELGPALGQAGYPWTEFRYLNDQAIEFSAQALADQWSDLPADQTVVLVGHSMGGLVIRDYVTRAMARQQESDATIVGALLIGTPNQGSEWARLRVWLELRDRFGSDEQDDYSLFAGLRDGTGAAKIDLRPGSRFLEDLNSRPWPEDIPLRILGGQITGTADPHRTGLKELAVITQDPDWAEGFGNWLDESSDQLGDGVVPISALPAPGAPQPDLVTASHRGLLVSGPLNAGEPPGIPWVLEQLAQMGRTP